MTYRMCGLFKMSFQHNGVTMFESITWKHKTCGGFLLMAKSYKLDEPSAHCVKCHTTLTDKFIEQLTDNEMKQAMIFWQEYFKS